MRPGLDARGQEIVHAATAFIVGWLEAKGEQIGDKGRGRIERDVAGFMTWFLYCYESEGPAVERFARMMLAGTLETKAHAAAVIEGNPFAFADSLYGEGA